MIRGISLKKKSSMIKPSRCREFLTRFLHEICLVAELWFVVSQCSFSIIYRGSADCLSFGLGCFHRWWFINVNLRINAIDFHLFAGYAVIAVVVGGYVDDGMNRRQGNFRIFRSGRFADVVSNSSSRHRFPGCNSVRAVHPRGLFPRRCRIG